MRQELIDLLLGELEPDRAEALKQCLASDPALARELKDLESLFGLMRRGEEIEPSPAMDRTVRAAAARSCRPSLWTRVRQLPGLVGYRFRQSVAFRAATLALAAHLVVMAVLFQIVVDRAAPTGPIALQPPQPVPVAHEPARSFVSRLQLRRLPHRAKLAQFGVNGQEEAIRRGLDDLVARQAPDGSFGGPADTAWATLALLAEGDCSASETPRGEAIRAAIAHLLAAGEVHGAVLAAFVEDYALAYDALHPDDQLEYSKAIQALIARVEDDPISREALALAQLADFGVPAGRDLAEAAVLLGGDRAPLLARKPSRLSATVVLARGHQSLDRDRVRAWARPLFVQAMAELSQGNVSGVVLLALQAPYRL